MIALGNLLIATAAVLGWVIFIFYWLILAHVILSWVSPDPRNPIVQFIYSVTEPILLPVRKRMPRFGMFDLSPIAVFLALLFLDHFLVATLKAYGHQFASAGVMHVG